MSDEVTITLPEETAQSLIECVGHIPLEKLRESGVNKIICDVYWALKATGIKYRLPESKVVPFSAPKKMLDDDFVDRHGAKK